MKGNTVHIILILGVAVVVVAIFLAYKGIMKPPIPLPQGGQVPDMSGYKQQEQYKEQYEQMKQQYQQNQTPPQMPKFP